jgi:Rrf2 family protein
VKLQKNTVLALYSVLEFAAHPERQLAGAEVAAKYRISPHHLAKVLRALGRAGLVEAARGVGGGYRFAGNAKRVTLMDVIELFEDIGAARRAPHGRRRAGRKHAPAAPHEVEEALDVVLTEIDDIARATFRSISLETLLKLVERRRR